MNAYGQRFPWHVAPQEGFEPPDLLSLRFSGPPPSTSRPLRHLGTNGRHRTGDLLLMMELLCQLSYIGIWCPKRDSNSQNQMEAAFEAAAFANFAIRAKTDASVELDNQINTPTSNCLTNRLSGIVPYLVLAYMFLRQ